MFTVATMLQFIDLINEQTRQITEVSENSITMEMLDVNMFYFDEDGEEHNWEDLLPFPPNKTKITYGDGNLVTITFDKKFKPLPYVWVHCNETKRFKEHWFCSNCEGEVIETPRYTNFLTGKARDFVFCPYCGKEMKKDEKGRVSICEYTGKYQE